VLRVLGQNVTREDIDNEASAINKLSRGGHQNLVTVLRNDWLDSSCYFIDMELCDTNLDKFIYQELDWTPFKCSEHTIIDHDPPIWWRTAECLNIMFQIASGLEFIHGQGHVHRDLKPQNSNIPSWIELIMAVLYSGVSKNWKIADFGITSEASGTRSTRFARGTESYRAPELLGVVGQMRYSSKSDIWSVGVILYELFMRRKAFAGDLGVMGWALSSGQTKEIRVRRLEMKEDLLCERCAKDILEWNAEQHVLEEINLVLKRALEKEPHQRPSAEELKSNWQPREK
jgi:serine/threonine protein kinase